MANTIIQIKHSTVQGNVPVSLANGEISINTRDGKLFYAHPNGTIQEFTEFPGPSGLNQEIQFNDAGVLGANSNLTYNKSTGYFKAPIIESTNNGNGTNFKVGDDAWIGDVNSADSLRISGQQNSANAYIIFGSSDTSKLGRAGTGALTYTGAFTATGEISGNELTSTMSSGDEGGQINLSIPVTNTTLTGKVTIDIYQNKLRFFQGDSAKGAYIDLTVADAGVGTNLLNPSATPDTIARNTANAAFIKANNEGNVNLTQNTNITNAQNRADSAFAQSNAAFTVANSAFTTSNGTIAWNTANAAFLAANTADVKGTSAGVYANGAFIAANSAGVYANAAFATANATMTSANGTIAWNTANAAFIAANAATATDTTQNNSITAAFTAANSAGVYANGAFAQANTDFTNVSIAAGTYGNATHYGVVTVASNGRVTNVQTYTMQDPNSLAFAIALG